jgi:two-component system, NarL family, response regulator NreC
VTDDAPISVVLADDHTVVRAGIRLLLQGAPGISVVGEADGADGVRQLVRARRPDVCVLDLNMPGGGIAAISDLAGEHPRLPIVVLTMVDDVAVARAALAAGASAFVVKDSPAAELVRAVRVAAGGGRHISPGLALRVIETPGPPDGLTEREMDVLRLVALGHTNEAVAARLYLSVRTVEAHRAHVGHKLGLRTRADLVSYALKRGLLRADP